MDTKIAAEIAQILVSLFTGFGLIYAGWQVSLLKKTHQQNHDWNRRIAAQGAIESLRPLASITIELNDVFDTTNATEAIPLQRILDVFKDDKSIQVKVHQLLNSYEALARGVYQSIYDESVIKAARRGPMIQQFEAFSSYIKYRRKNVLPKAYVQMEALVNKWKSEEEPSDQLEPTGTI